MPPPLTLRLLGPPAVFLAGEPAPHEVLWRKHLALLAWLTLATGRRAPRASLQALLWPDDEARARRSLNEAIRRLRLLLGRSRITTVRDMIELSGEALDADVLGVPAAAECYRPPLLEGVDYADAPEFEEWVAAARVRLTSMETAALVHAADRCASAGMHADAAAHAARVLARDPLHTGAARLVMEAMALAGQRLEALEAWRRHLDALRDVGVSPGSELVLLAQRIEAMRGPAAVRSDAPLVGRHAARATLSRAMERALDGVPTALLITGEVGSGRSRILGSCAERAALAGAITIRVRAVPDDVSTPWSLLRLLLRAGLDHCPGTLAVPPSLLGVVAWFAPSLADRVAPRPPADEGEVADAVAGLLQGIGDEQPLFIAIDDADLADASSLEALRLALGAVRSAPVVLALATAPLHAGSSAALLHQGAALARDVAGVRVDLQPFSLHETEELVLAVATWCGDAADRNRLARRLHHETGGDPLMSVVLLEALEDLAGMRPEMLRWPPPQHTFESPLPVSVPAVLRMAMLGRVAALNPADRRLLGVAAASGVRPDLGLVAQRTGQSQDEVEAAMVRLEHARLVHADGDGFAFPAPLYAELLAHECLTPGERRVLTRRATQVPA